MFCKIRAPIGRLKEEADALDYVLRLDPVQLQIITEMPTEDEQIEKKWKPLFIIDEKGLSHRKPFDNIYGKVLPRYNCIKLSLSLFF